MPPTPTHAYALSSAHTVDPFTLFFIRSTYPEVVAEAREIAQKRGVTVWIHRKGQEPIDIHPTKVS